MATQAGYPRRLAPLEFGSTLCEQILLPVTHVEFVSRLRYDVRVLRIACCLLLSLAVPGCGAQNHRTTTLSHSTCKSTQYWDGDTCQPRDQNVAILETGATALAAFRVEEALKHLKRAKQKGPYSHAAHIRLYEQLGIAHSYLGNESEALSAFDMLLSLAPQHLLSYTLSPKVTFLFERARKQKRRLPALQLNWPRNLDVTKPVPVEIEVIEDPKRFLNTAEIHVRRKGASTFNRVEVRLSKPGNYQRVSLPPPKTAQPETLQVYVTASDKTGNQVLSWASKETPRELSLGYTPPQKWYKKWWVWAAVGSAVAASTGAIVYGATREPSTTVGGTIDILR